MSIRRSFLLLSVLPTFVVVLDAVIRFPYLRVLELSLLQHYLYSYLFEWTICFTVIWLISFSDTHRTVFIAAAAYVLSLIQLTVYGHYFYFGVLPNPYSINYFIDHNSDSLSLMLSSVTWMHAAVFLLLSSIQYQLLRLSLRGCDAVPVRYRISVLGIFLACVIVFNNNVRFAPASYSITPATLFSVKYALQERWFGSTFELHHGYMRRRFEIADRPRVNAKWNCVLFLSESVRKRSFSAYGYGRPTTPFLDSMVNAGAIIRFDHHVSNAVSTQYSVPMLLSGDFTIAKVDHPFIYDYLKKRTDARTYFFTSQSMQRSNIDLVYNTSLDTFVCQEKLPYEPFNDLGVDDEEAAEDVKEFHRRRNGERFFSIIQFNNTHFPYTVKQSASQFFSTGDSAVVDRYDNTILEQDRILRSYFTAFQQSGLLDSTVILFSSDHGEAFGERGHLGHLNTLYGEEIDVPQWVYLPKGFPAEKRRAMEQNAVKATSHLDLFPTMMELFDAVESTVTGSVFRGRSLFQPLPEERRIPVVGKDMIDTKAVIAGRFKYIETNRDGSVTHEAYHLRDDPKELTNIWRTLPDQKQKEMIEQFRLIDAVSIGPFHR